MAIWYGSFRKRIQLRNKKVFSVKFHQILALWEWNLMRSGIPQVLPSGQQSYYYHFTDGKTKAERGELACQEHIARRWQSQDAKSAWYLLCLTLRHGVLSTTSFQVLQKFTVQEGKKCRSIFCRTTQCFLLQKQLFIDTHYDQGSDHGRVAFELGIHLKKIQSICQVLGILYDKVRVYVCSCMYYKLI